MGDRSGRQLRNRRSVKEEPIRAGVAKERSIVESQGEVELVLKESSNRDPTMEGVEALKEFGRVMAENMNRQIEEQREYYREREERNLASYKTLVEGQMKSHKEDAEAIAKEFEKIRIDKENNSIEYLMLVPFPPLRRKFL